MDRRRGYELGEYVRYIGYGVLKHLFVNIMIGLIITEKKLWS